MTRYARTRPDARMENDIVIVVRAYVGQLMMTGDVYTYLLCRLLFAEKHQQECSVYPQL